MSQPTDPGVPSPGERPPRWYVAANAALDAWEIGHRRSAMYAAMGELREACREFAARASLGDSPAGEPDVPLEAKEAVLEVLTRMGLAGGWPMVHLRATASMCAKAVVAAEPCVHCGDRMGRGDDACFTCYGIAKGQVGVLQEQLDALRAALPSGDATTPPDALRDRYEAALRRIVALDDPAPTFRLLPDAPESGACRTGEISPYAHIAREALASRPPVVKTLDAPGLHLPMPPTGSAPTEEGRR